ncbi:murein DD-endopeptidase MepM/ murein hydrolase activator NlpD [Stackebrandtia albiflava]|uniref:Murein DD-endopeptidase MepM/ murein hydrolase activator NlpD n=1 Tax=Stackebrandtia albiflava TaxID=406432 RepID=A0A562V4P1_9ACTN|nr:murein DD-endopeptidase MepM/ murein hydrolase activator NlpD [Stackebrandtia albiflava]
MLAALVFAGTASAEPSTSDQQRIDEELAQAEATLEGATEAAREAALALTETEELLPAARDRANTARGAVAAAESLAAIAGDEADTARATYRGAVADYDTAAGEVDTARAELGDLVRLSYQGAGIMAVNGVITADDPFEAVARMSYVQELADRQNAAVDEVVKLRQEARDAENDAEVARDAAEAAETAATEALETAEAEAAAAETAERELADLLDTRTAALAVAEDEKEASLARYEEVKEESERIAAALRDVGSGHATAGSQSGAAGARLLMPVQGWKSSDFGNRYDPYYHVWQLHAGVDFAAGGGAPIVAADSGQVVQAGWNGGYGNYTCIYHGDNLSTCYAHQSSIGVSVGQWVDRGDRIGAVGTTGASTGDHLHFEVRLNGSPVEPLRWLPGCLC